MNVTEATEVNVIPFSELSNEQQDALLAARRAWSANPYDNTAFMAAVERCNQLTDEAFQRTLAALDGHDADERALLTEIQRLAAEDPINQRAMRAAVSRAEAIARPRINAGRAA